MSRGISRSNPIILDPPSSFESPGLVEAGFRLEPHRPPQTQRLPQPEGRRPHLRRRGRRRGALRHRRATALRHVPVRQVRRLGRAGPPRAAPLQIRLLRAAGLGKCSSLTMTSAFALHSIRLPIGHRHSSGRAARSKPIHIYRVFWGCSALEADPYLQGLLQGAARSKPIHISRVLKSACRKSARDQLLYMSGGISPWTTLLFPEASMISKWRMLGSLAPRR